MYAEQKRYKRSKTASSPDSPIYVDDIETTTDNNHSTQSNSARDDFIEMGGYNSDTDAVVGSPVQPNTEPEPDHMPEAPWIGNFSLDQISRATQVGKETLTMDFNKQFRIEEDYTRTPSYSELMTMNTYKERLFYNATSNYTVLDTVLFMNGILRKFPSTPVEAINFILKWLHRIADGCTCPESIEGLNAKLEVTKRIKKVPYCNCGHVFDPTLNEQQECPRCHAFGFVEKYNSKTPSFVPRNVFYYSPLIYKHMDLVAYSREFLDLARERFPEPSYKAGHISSFVDAKQAQNLMQVYKPTPNDVYLALCEMVDGMARSISSDESLVVQLIRNTSFPSHLRNRYKFIFVTALCGS